MNSRAMSSKPWHVHAAGAFGCVLLTAVAYVTAIQPVADAHVVRLVQSAQLSEQRKISQELDETLSRLHRDLTRVEAELESSELKLQSAGRINQRIAELTDIATTCGLKIQAINPGNKHSDRLFDAVPIELGGQATYRNYLRFLQELHARFPDIAVAEIKISGRPDDSTDVAQFKLKLCWFTARETLATGN